VAHTDRRYPDAPPPRGPVFVACLHRCFQHRRGLVARRAGMPFVGLLLLSVRPGISPTPTSGSR
jgi:hypothetical protein